MVKQPICFCNVVVHVCRMCGILHCSLNINHKPYSYSTLLVKSHCALCRKGGTGGGGWGHPQSDMHMVAARLGCERAVHGWDQVGHLPP